MNTAHIVKTLREYAVQNGINCDCSLSEHAAARLLDVHLDDKNFPMPCHSQSTESALLESVKANTYTPKIITEDTRSLLGIVRVLIRTRLNSQGVGRVAKDAKYKTEAPRVMEFFSEVNEEEIIKWLNWDYFITRWIKLTENWDQDKNEEREAIREMKKIAQQDVLLSKNSKLKILDINWWRVIRGFYSGLHYLNEEYDLNPKNIWATLDGISSFSINEQSKRVSQLTENFSKHVREYGDALAGSFYSDLGSPRFVKNDTHVSSVTAAINKSKIDKADFTESLNMCFLLANHHDCSPRAIDKLMFFAAGGGYYLAGLKMDKKTSAEHKKNLLSSLRML